MKKLVSIFIILFFGLLSFLLFHDIGNMYLKPYLSTYLESQLKQDMSVKIQDLKIDLKHIEVVALLNGLTTINADGEVLILDKKLNLNYTINSNGFKHKQISFSNKIDVKGTIKGHFDDIDVVGKGHAFGSRVTYNFKYKDELINNINLNLKKADISELLLVMAQPAYAKGKIDIDINIPTFNINRTKGEADIVLHHTTLDEKVINKKFEINLPPKTILSGIIHSNIDHNRINFNSKIVSNLSTIRLNNAVYNLDNNRFSSNYIANIPNLSKLNSLVGKKLKGKITLNGKIKSDKMLIFTGKTTDLGGNIDFKLYNQQLTSNINTISVQKLIYMLDYPQIFRATLDGDFHYDLTKQKGVLNSRLNKARLLENKLTKLVKQNIGVDLTKEHYNKTTFVARLNNNDINFDFNAKSKKVLISFPNGHLNKLRNRINTKYRLVIDNKDISGKIKGDIFKPHITISSSKYIQEQVVKGIEKYIGKDKLKDLGVGKEESKAIKNILGDFFR